MKGLRQKYLSNREKSQRWEQCGRILSVESNCTVFKRRLLQFQSRRSTWTKSTIVLSYCKSADTDWRKKTFQKFWTQRRESLWIEWPGSVQKFLNGMRTDPSCDYWHPPVCQKYRTSVTIVCLDILRLVDGPVKSQRNVVERDQLSYWRSSYNWVVYPKIVLQESRLFGNLENRDQMTPPNPPRARGTTWKFGKERIHRKELRKSVNLETAVRGRQNSSEEHMKKTLQQERCVRRDAKDLTNNVYMLKNKEKATFCSPNEAWVMLAPSSKKPEEREFVVDSGASMHMLSKNHWSSDEVETLRKSMNPTTVVTVRRSRSWSLRDGAITRWNACRPVIRQALRRARFYLRVGQAVKSHIWPKMRRGIYAKQKTSYLFLSLNCRQIMVPVRPLHRHRRTQVQQQSEVTIQYEETDAIHQKHKNQKRDNNRASEETDYETFWCRAYCGLGIVAKYQLKFVFCFVPAGLTKYVFGSNKFTTWRYLPTRRDPPKTKSQNLNEDHEKAAGSRLRDLPEWLEEFTDNFEDAEVPASANISPDSDSERPSKVASRKHIIHTHFPRDRNCEVCKRTKMTRTPCRRRTGN